MRWVLLALAPFVGACGYHFVGPDVGGGRSIAVPVSDNDTRWRGIESDLTRSLRSDVQRILDMRLQSEPADLVLHTKIHDVTRAAPVRSRFGTAAAGSAVLDVEWRLDDAEGKSVGKGTIRRTLEFLPSEGQSATTAIAEILDSIAEYVVIEVGTTLSNAPSQN